MSLTDDNVEHDAAGSAGEWLLGTLIDDAHHAPPDELASLVSRAAEGIGAREAVIYLVGYEQQVLTPLPGDGVAPRERIDVDHTLGGRAFTTLTILVGEADGGQRLWVPLLEGTSRLGVLEVTVPDADAVTQRRMRQLAGLVAALVLTRNRYGDEFKVARRVQDMSVAAEMQWDLLPPSTFSDGRVTITGVLEPSYRVAGDTFDYALNGNRLHLAVIDAMGHGFEATVMATVATGVYRHARRLGQGLAESYAAIDDAIVRQFGIDRFVTGQLVELDTRTGVMRWLNAGHPPPLLARGTKVVGPLSCEPTLPIGFGGAVAEVAEHQLEPEDRLVFMTDGVLEGRSGEGEFFGEERLSDFIERAIAAGLSAPETVRRLAAALLDHQGGTLADDATTIFVQWHGRDRVAMPPLPVTPSGDSGTPLP